MGVSARGAGPGQETEPDPRAGEEGVETEMKGHRQTTPASQRALCMCRWEDGWTGEECTRGTLKMLIHLVCTAGAEGGTVDAQV